jgi:hypothetical protein
LGFQPVDPNLRAPSASPGAFGAQIGQAIQGLGQSGEQAASTAFQIASNLQTLQVHADMNQRFHQLQDYIQKKNFGDPSDPNAPPGFYSLQGQDAVKAYPDAIRDINNFQQNLSTGLPPAAQSEFEEITRRYADGQFSEMGQHYIRQNQAYLNDTDQAVIDGDHQNAVAYYNNPDAFMNALADSQRTVVRMSQRNGLSGEAVNQAVADNRSKLFSAVIDRQAQENPLAAWQFYQAHQGQIGGVYQAAIEQQLAPKINLWNSGNVADSIMSGNTGQVAASVAQTAQEEGVDPSLALTTAKIESGMGRNLGNAGSTAKGIFQLTDGTWATQGGTAANRNDPTAQVQLGIKNLGQAQQAAQTALGRAPEPWETYIVHQQGIAGGPALLKADPNASAVDVLTPLYASQGGASAARQAIVNNGGTATMTAGQFLALWQHRYDQAASTVQVPLSPSLASAVGASPSAPPGVPTSPDPRAHLADWLAQANGVPDFRGDQNPVFQNMVAERIKQKVGEIEYGQQQTDRAAKSVLVSAAMGMPNPAALPINGTGAPPAMKSAPPMSLEEMFQQSPQSQQAFLAADPETQRSVMEMLRQNANQGPPATEAAIDRYYQLRSESVNAPADFLKENLADHDLVTSMPREYLHQLMNIQSSIDKNAAAQAQRQISLTHAREVVMPDLLAAGIDPNAGRKSPNSPAATAFAAFDGRLDEALQQFQQTNNRRPNDSEIKSMGETLLTPGYLRGTGSLWGLLPNDTSTRLFAAQAAGNDAKFYPAIPSTDRAAIVTAYQSKHGGQLPTDAQVQTYWMMGRSMRSPAAGSGGPPRPRLPFAPVDNGAAPPAAPTQAMQVGPVPAS